MSRRKGSRRGSKTVDFRSLGYRGASGGIVMRKIVRRSTSPIRKGAGGLRRAIRQSYRKR